MSRSAALRILAFVAILAASVGCDHLSKRVAVSVLAPTRSVSVAGDALRFELAWNPGAFLSLGAGLPEAVRQGLLLVGVPAALAVVCLLIVRSGPLSPLQLLGLALVAGGGLGNWTDRLLHGGLVTDFVSLGLGPLRTGIFNVADVSILTGLALLLLAGHSRGPAPGSVAEPAGPPARDA